MRRLLVLLLLPCFGPWVYVLMDGVMRPENYIKNWGMSSCVLISGGGILGLVGIFCLSVFRWNGARLARPSYLAATLIGFATSMFLFALKAGWFDRDSLVILLHYTGWWTVVFIAAFTVPTVATVILVWASRRYVFARRTGAGSTVQADIEQSQRTLIVHRHALAAAAAVLAGVVVSHQVLYRLLLIPRLDEWQFVPLNWWLIVALPVMVAALAGGTYLVQRHQLVLAAVLAGAATEAYVLVAAMNHSPGFSHALVEPIAWAIWFSTVRFVLIATWYGALLSLGWLIRRFVGAVRRALSGDRGEPTRFRGSVHQ